MYLQYEFPMVQWKMAPPKGNSYWRYTHFPLNHDYGKKGKNLIIKINLLTNLNISFMDG